MSDSEITAIKVYKSAAYVDGPITGGRAMSLTLPLASVVLIETNAGISGVGEFSPCGENYIEGHSEGGEALRMIGPRLLGEDPQQLGRIEQIMDHTILGHAYAKSPVDVACWDILGKATGQPLGCCSAVSSLTARRCIVSPRRRLNVEAEMENLYASAVTADSDQGWCRLEK